MKAITAPPCFIGPGGRGIFTPSAAMLPVVSWALGEPGVVATPPLVLGALAYQTVVVAFVSYLAWFWLIRSYPASQLAAFSFLTPLLGVLAGGLLLGERITAALIAAMAFVGLGIYLVNRRPAAAALPERSVPRESPLPFPPPQAGEGEINGPEERGMFPSPVRSARSCSRPGPR